MRVSLTLTDPRPAPATPEQASRSFATQRDAVAWIADRILDYARRTGLSPWQVQTATRWSD